MRAIEAIEQVDWTRYIEDLKEHIEDTEARVDRLRVSPIAETSSLKHRAALLESLRDLVNKTREQIKDRQANVRAKAIGPCPDLGELFGIYETHDEAFDVLYAWFDAVWELPKPQREAMLGRAEDDLSCGDPGHDYTDHLVEYEGRAILDTQLSEGAKGTPLTGPGWTEVDPEQWSDEYKHEQRRRQAPWN